MIVTTESGTRYEFSPSQNQVRRLGGEGMRRDGEWLNFEFGVFPEIGESMVLLLEPLGGGTVTIRTTTPVVSITDD